MSDHIERSLILVKPDGVQRGLIGRIISRFEEVGFTIVAAKMVWADEDLAQDHYEEHLDKPFYDGLESLLTSGPVMAFIIEGVHAVEKARQMIGATEPRNAAPGTIRGDYASMDNAFADEQGIGCKNLVHASATPDEARDEINLWFEESEQHSYETVHDEHTAR